MRSASSAHESPCRAADAVAREFWGLWPWRIVYGLYAWLQFLLVSLVTLTLSLCLPSLRARRRLTRWSSGLALRLAGMRVRAAGLDTLPHPCVVVANHASYLDGVVLNGVLPVHFSFVIKREMASVPLAGLLLRRLGAEFVDRRGRAQGLGDARRLLRQAASGQALVFFPEGTFGPATDLGHFHIGAFAAAARAGLPIVPIVIRGTRRCLTPGSFWPRPGRIEVQALAVVPNASSASSSADRATRAALLRDRAHQAIMAALVEADPSAADVASRH